MATKLELEPTDIANEWLDLYLGEDGGLAHDRQQVERARAELAQAESTRRHNAVVALRYGAEKHDVARLLRISRPTLDAWIETVYSNQSELDKVQATLDSQRRRVEWERERAAA